MKSIKDHKIYIAGHNGMVGSACWRVFEKNGFKNLIGINSSELDLTIQNDVEGFFSENKPDFVINAAAKVGGILANSNYPYDFLLKNLQIQNNLILNSHKFNIKKFVFLGSSCIYPKYANQPIKEEYLLNGDLEPTNQWYAIAKIAGLKLCEAIRQQFKMDFFSLMPTNLYGINDNYNLETSHVLPALIRKFHEAKVNNLNNVILWGTGNPLREFLYADDLAEAILHTLMINHKESIINVGSGIEVSIKELAHLISEVVNYEGKISWDLSKPDGTPRKLLDSSIINKLGWKNRTGLYEGINKTYKSFLKNIND